MKRASCYFILVMLMVWSLPAWAQQPFVEGRIKYAVSIGPVSDSAGFTEHAGTYTLIIKGGQIRKEVLMNSGYQNILLVNNSAGSAYSLTSNGGQHYAIQLTMQDLKKDKSAMKALTKRTFPGI